MRRTRQGIARPQITWLARSEQTLHHDYPAKPFPEDLAVRLAEEWALVSARKPFTSGRGTVGTPEEPTPVQFLLERQHEPVVCAEVFKDAVVQDVPADDALMGLLFQVEVGTRDDVDTRE